MKLLIILFSITLAYSVDTLYIKKCFLKEIPDSIKKVRESDNQITYTSRIMDYKQKKLLWNCVYDLHCMPKAPCSYHLSNPYLYEIKYELYMIRKELMKK